MAKDIKRKNVLMGEVREEKGLQLELTRMRNPYLDEEFGNASRRRKGTASGSGPRQGSGMRQGSGRRTKMSRERQRRLRQLQRRRRLSIALIASFAAVCLFWWLTSLFLQKGSSQPVNAAGTVSVGDYLPQKEKQVSSLPVKPDWTENYLTPNEYSRPGEALEKIDNIFVHYTANAGTSAAQNRSYFEQLKDTHERHASAHFIIGYEGEILQVIPLDEIACAVQTRNYDSISIECCYLAEDGSFTKETYESLINLLAWLLETYDLEPQDILRHYDCGGKKCPLYYTEHADEWEKLKEDVGERLAGNGE